MQDPAYPPINIQPSSLSSLLDTKERPFKCGKCKSTFIRRDILLRHDRTVHAKDGDRLQPEMPKKSGPKTPSSTTTPSKPSISIEPRTLEQIEASSGGMLDLETSAMLMTDFQYKAAAAANDALHNGEGSIPEYSPDRTSILEPSDYLTGSTSLPHMPWDFVSQGPWEEKAHPMTSSMLSQDNLSQQPYVYMGSIQPERG
jgi:hypothetical protein